MECGQNVCLNNPLLEVTEWHKQEQITYWKSRAISLELENRMLHQHLRNVYAKQIEDYAASLNQNDAIVESKPAQKALKPEEEKTVKEPRWEHRFNKDQCIAEMKRLYGDKTDRIKGMETAMQLNFDLRSEKTNPTYWPHMPLNLTFK